MKDEILILRDPRESARKCSLTPLRGQAGIRFETFHPERRLDASGRILLHPDGEELSAADRERPILLVDCAWRRLPTLLRNVDGDPAPRRLPTLETAYPRRSRFFVDPSDGLASVEALFAVLALLGRPRSELLDGYPWRELFRARNPRLFAPGAQRARER